MNKNDLPKVTESVGGSFGNKSSPSPLLPVTIFSIEPQSLPQLMSLSPYSKAVTCEQLNWIPSDNEMPPKAHGVRVKMFCNSLLFISSFGFPKFIATLNILRKLSSSSIQQAFVHSVRSEWGEHCWVARVASFRSLLNFVFKIADKRIINIPTPCF